MTVHPKAAQCHNTNKANETQPDATQCGAALDRMGLHASACETGPTRYRPHTAVRDAMVSVVEDACAEVESEIVVPKLHHTKVGDKWHFTSAIPQPCNSQAETREAKLDLSVWSAASPVEIPVDITVRNPIAHRYLAQAAHTPGHAVNEAKKEKLRRYGAASSVACAGIETYGRMHTDFHNLLHHLDQVASAISPNPSGHNMPDGHRKSRQP